MDRDVELIDAIILFGGIGIFTYYFFFVPPTIEIITFPIYTVRYTYSAVIYVAPIVVIMWLLMLLLTNFGEKRIRDLQIKKKIGILWFNFRVKLDDGIKEYHSWRKENRKR